MGISRDDVLKQVHEHGPTVATKIASVLGCDSYLIGAYLSELVDVKQVLLTKSTGAGSPLYYVSTQTEKLVLLRERLKEQDKRTFDLIRDELVLKDSDLEPLTRVSIQKLGDFAHDIRIRMGEETVVFWKWYTLSNADVIAILQKRYSPVKEPEKKETSSPKTQSPQESSSTQGESQQTLASEQSAHSPVSQFSIGVVSHLEGLKSSAEVMSTLEKHGVIVRKSIDIKKGTECDCICDVPTAFGIQPYFVKILLKKKITETDLQAVYLQGVLKQKPTCLLTNGELVKKAELLHAGELRSMMVVMF